MRALQRSGVSSTLGGVAGVPRRRQSRRRRDDEIRRAQAGDEKAFEAIYEANRRRVYWLCLRMTRNPDDAEDLTQEAFLQVYRKLHTFRGDSSFSTWLHRVTANIVLMRLRKSTLAEVPLADDSGPDGESGELHVGRDDLRLSGSLDRVALERSIDELPPGYRAVLILHDVYGYEHKEIAQLLGFSMGNSKSQLHKARLKLRVLLRGAAEETAAAAHHATSGTQPLARALPLACTTSNDGGIIR